MVFLKRSSSNGAKRRDVRLGKLPPRLDPRTLQLANYLRADTPQPPLNRSDRHAEQSAFRGVERPRLELFRLSSEQGTTLPETRLLAPAPRSVDWTAQIPSWPMFANDTLGDCTSAAAAHMIQCWTANAGHAFTPTNAQVIAAYSATGHYIAGNPATDQGAVELDVLNFWRQQGIAGHKIAAYVSFSPQNLEHTRQAINLFGGIYIGLALPISAQNQDVWDVPSFFSRVAAFFRRGAACPTRFAQNHARIRSLLVSECGDSSPLCHSLPTLGTSADSTSLSCRESSSLKLFASGGLSNLELPTSNLQNNFTPGSWGGHAVPILAYDADTLTCITWGAKKRMTWEFFARYCDESYAPLSPDWLNAQGKDPEGLDLTQLRADLSEIAGNTKYLPRVCN